MPNKNKNDNCVNTIWIKLDDFKNNGKNKEIKQEFLGSIGWITKQN